MQATLRIEKYCGEYRVAVYLNGTFSEGPTYYACDKDDAFSSMVYMEQELTDKGYDVTTSKKIMKKDWR